MYLDKVEILYKVVYYSDYGGNLGYGLKWIEETMQDSIEGLIIFVVYCLLEVTLVKKNCEVSLGLLGILMLILMKNSIDTNC